MNGSGIRPMRWRNRDVYKRQAGKNADKTQLLQIAGSLEKGSEHPLAEAIAVSYTHLGDPGCDVRSRCDRTGTDRNRKDSIFWYPGASQSLSLIHI